MATTVKTYPFTTAGKKYQMQIPNAVSAQWADLTIQAVS